MCRYGKTLKSFKSLSARLGWVQHEDTKSIVYEAWRDTQLHIASLMNHCSVPWEPGYPIWRKGKSSKCTFKKGICYFPGGYASFPTTSVVFLGLPNRSRQCHCRNNCRNNWCSISYLRWWIQSLPPLYLEDHPKVSEVVNNPLLLAI